ncbi:MAG TPA: transposase [Caulifigura sp.]|jgi:putative transposase|nr:transposase [Caulifigura sp.]
MRRYIRNREGRCFFFTLVSDERRPILTSDLGRACLRSAFLEVKKTRPFDLTAVVLLPDHLHAVWTLPKGDCDYSTRWQAIKADFTRRWLAGGGGEGTPSESRRNKGERSVWQRRFYERTCRDEADFKRCVDYVHVNPLKHELVTRVCDWPWSSFHRYVRLGEYAGDWGSADVWYGDEFRDAE